MFSVLAATLLMTPPNVTDQCPDKEDWPGIQEAIQTLAVQWEILDPREVGYIMARPEDWDNDLILLRNRYQELKDAPRLCESLRFPDRGYCNEVLAFNRSYRGHLNNAAPLYQDRAELMRTVMAETDSLYKVWDAVRDARCEYYYITGRRQALKRLKEQLHPEDFMSGELPFYVPLHRFREK